MIKEIVKATSRDINKIFEMDQENFDDNWSIETIKSSIENQYSSFYILQIDDITIGYFNFELIFDEINLNRICVLPRYRNQGFAKNMMDRLIDISSKENCRRITLEVEEKNENAIKLYENYSFNTIYVRKDYYGKNNHGLIMERIKNE